MRGERPFRLLASGLEFPEGPVALPDGSVVLVEIKAGCLSRVSADGRVERIAVLGGSPNGAAIGPDGKCYVCNSGGFRWHTHLGYGLAGSGQPADYSGGRIERVDLATGRSEVLYSEGPDGGLRGPNDLVFDRSGGFWFTDSGKVRDHDRDHGAVYYARADGSWIRRVIYPYVHPHPNGIGLSPDETTLYVAETATGRVWSFAITGPGEIRPEPFPSPNGGRLVAGLAGYQLLDSMCLEADGNICVATLMDGAITVLAPDGGIVEQIACPDILPTNICFGGAGLRTAFVTLGATGRLVAFEWPRPGLKLNFLND